MRKDLADALGTSWRLVKGRWWATFVEVFLPCLLLVWLPSGVILTGVLDWWENAVVFFVVIVFFMPWIVFLLLASYRARMVPDKV